MELSRNIQKNIRKYEAVETDGLTLYPILVKDFDYYLASKPAIEIMQQSLPVRLMSVPLLQAFYALDYEAITTGGEPVGLMYRALLFLGLSLRLSPDDPEAVLHRFRIVADPNDPSRLKGVDFVVNGEEMHRITPVLFQRLRPILAAQNGIKLESDDANPELVEAERVLAETGNIKLSGDPYEMIATIAALERIDEAEIEDWPILKLQTRETTWRRIIGYQVCAIGQASGASWKGGNPHPSLFYERGNDGISAALAPLSSLKGAEQAVVSTPSEKE